MTASEFDRRVPVIIALAGLVLFILFIEQGVLRPGVDAMQPAEEIAYWEAHVLRNKDYAESHIRLALAYQRADRRTDALSEFETALKLNPESEEATIGRYGILFSGGERNSAVTLLADYARDHPNCGICWQNLASAYLELGRMREAETAVEALLASPMRVTTGMYSARNLHFEAEMVAGRVYAELGRYERALELFRDATRREPNNVRGYVVQAKVFVVTGQAQEALAVLDEADRVVAADDASMKREIQRLRSKVLRKAASR